MSGGSLSIEPFDGPRSILLPLFAEADDSPAEIFRYIESGEVLVACRGARIVGHIQLVRDGAGAEIQSVAVAGEERGRGVGSALISAALGRAFSTGAARVAVATATADIRNLRFYQRLGFRMERVERDVFTRESGYPDLTIDGIPLRDRVWLSIDRDAGLRSSSEGDYETQNTAGPGRVGPPDPIDRFPRGRRARRQSGRIRRLCRLRSTTGSRSR